MRPVDISDAMLGAGITEISVRRRPRVVVIPTGDELIQPGSRRGRADRRVNSAFCAAWSSGRRAVGPRSSGQRRINSDEDPRTVGKGRGRSKRRLLRWVPKTTRSTSSGEHGEVVLHGVSIKPGNRSSWPLSQASLSWACTAIRFDRPHVRAVRGSPWFSALQGDGSPGRDDPRADVAPNGLALGREEFLRVKVGRVGENVVATPISRGAGVSCPSSGRMGSSGSPPRPGVGAGVEIDVALLRPAERVSKDGRLHRKPDNAGPVANALKKRHPEMSLPRPTSGSLGGLLALKRGRPIAGTHQLHRRDGNLERLLSQESPSRQADDAHPAGRS